MTRKVILSGVAVLVALSAMTAWLVRKGRWPTAAVMAVGVHAGASEPPRPAVPATGPTVVKVGPAVLRDDAKRLGINLGTEAFYDSHQVLKNLVSRNPGFEGLQWQSIVRCGQVTATSCTDAAGSGAWPEGFLDGGVYEVITGAAKGQTGPIVHSTGAKNGVGATIQFAQGQRPLAANDTLVVRKTTPGDAANGWGVQPQGGASVATEYKDLSPSTPGAQALRLNASGPGQSVSVDQYFDSSPGQSFVQFRGAYTIRFRAKAVSGSSPLTVHLDRGWSGPGATLCRQLVPLTPNWKDYTLSFRAAEPVNAVGTVALGFNVTGAEVLLDDVSLTEVEPNGTAFRNDVLATLTRLKPGVLRYMDSGQNWGSSLDNMLAPQFARRRSGYSRYAADAGDIPIGLHDFLVLSEKLGAEPWYTIQMGWSEQEAANLVEYLGGATTTKYGAVRAALGHPEPWTTAFPMIHLEYGNESWNDAQPGQAIPDAAAYSERASAMFRAIRGAAAYSQAKFNLIANGQSVNTYQNAAVVEKTTGLDTIDIAPYTFGEFLDDSSIEKIFGPMFAEPEMIDSDAKGIVHQQAEIAAKAAHPVKMAVYETNIGTVSGTVSQASLDAAVPSVGAGISSVEHMLLMLRDLGVTVQNTFQLGGGHFGFTNTKMPEARESSPVWGVVIDMGGPTNRVRPSFLAQQLANEAIRPTMLATSIGGANPTWDQPLSANNKIKLDGAHELQSFAFTDKTTSAVVLFNLSRTEARSLSLEGACAPQGTVRVKTLTSAKITDSNELEEKVKIVEREEAGVVAGKSVFALPPFSMTVVEGGNAGCLGR